ncbi:MAG TPA: hypothetical protein EYP85_10025 [Armatimonadetes bacterium]|nr:hypothetical protein [Armatimonadota bacterium]
MTLRELETLAFEGIDALVKRLGPVGAIRFIRLCTQGIADYTTERHRWLSKVEVNDLIQQAQERDRQDQR